jgi:predicted TIM-barrel fold metal-dependent hydrolase
MVGVEHTLWGSDYPGNPDVSASIDAIKELDIPSEDKKRILGANIELILT